MGLHFCARALSSCGKWGPLFIAVRGPLTTVASPVAGTDSRRTGSAIVAHGPSCSAACGILPDQGPNPCPLHWQADSQPLRHQGSPQMIFNAWFGYFEYVGYLLHGITLIVLNYCLDLIVLNFNWSTRLWNIIQREISRMKLLKPLLTRSISHSIFSIHCTNLFNFAFQLSFCLSWNNKA